VYFNEARDDCVEMASGGPYAEYLHFTAEPCDHLITGFFTGWIFFLLPNHQCQSTEGD